MRSAFKNNNTDKENSIRTKMVKFRATPEEVAALKKLADASGMPVGRYLREKGLGGSIKVTDKVVSTSSAEAFELRRLGAMLKALYPKESNWTADEKRQWWGQMNLLIGIAQKIEANGEADVG